MGKSPSARRNWISELSPVANVVVRKCSKILEIPTSELQDSFKMEASDPIKHPSVYARNFLEYCCFRALALAVQSTSHLSNNRFRRLTYNMMVAWETPAAASQSPPHADDDVSVGVEAFSRIAPAVPLIANVVVSENLFEVLTASTGGRLYFFIYDKYLSGRERAINKLKTQTESTTLLSAMRLSWDEKILEVDGNIPTQPVLEHVGMSTWPDHALHFESLKVVSYEKPKRYDLSEDLKQVVKPELTGPWGTRLFDKFPELKGHGRRDYWLAIIREILCAHRFINKFQIEGIGRDETLSKAVLGILRVQALWEITPVAPFKCESLLMFSLCNQLPGGDVMLEALAITSPSRELERTNSPSGSNEHGMYSISSLAVLSNLGFVFGGSSSGPSSPIEGLFLGEVAVGQRTPLEKAINESRNSYKKVAVAQAAVNDVKVDGIDTNMAVMKELLLPLAEIWNLILSLFSWKDPLKSLLFCFVGTFIIYRELVCCAFAVMCVFVAVFMVLTRYLNQGRDARVKVVAPPPKNTMEQLLAVQTTVSHAEGFIQDGNIILLKLCALLMSIYSRASEKLAATLLVSALVLAFLPTKYIVLMEFLEVFTRYSPARRASTERWTRRMKEWWFSIPAAPVLLERQKDDKKRK